MIGFADDVALVINVHNTELSEEAANPTLKTESFWTHNHGLNLAMAKTEAGMLTKNWTYCNPEVLVDWLISYTNQTIN